MLTDMFHFKRQQSDMYVRFTESWINSLCLMLKDKEWLA
jgi:hypothetical protein